MRHRGLAHLFGGDGTATRAAARGRGALGRVRGDRRGAAAMITAVAATSILGVAGLAVEVGNWYLVRRNMQAAADSAAMAGALSYENKAGSDQVIATARGVASRNGFVHGANGMSVDPVVAADGSVTVTMARPGNSRMLLAVGLSNARKDLAVSAMARVVDAGAPPCVHALSGQVSAGNNTDITAPRCGLVSDSDATDAFKIGSGGSVANGSGRIATANIVTHGGCEGCVEATDSGKLDLTRSPVPTTYAPKTRNPYEALDSWSPNPVGCVVMPDSLTLRPGCYTTFSVKPSETVTLTAGIYYIKGGSMDVKGTVRCSNCTRGGLGVSFVLIGNGSSPPGTVSFGSQAVVDLFAGRQPLHPDLDGVVIYRQPSRNGTSQGTGIDVSAGATLNLDGAVVGSDTRVTMGGNSSTGDQRCNVFIVASMDFSGNSNLSAQGCDLIGTKTSASRMVRLVQ